MDRLEASSVHPVIAGSGEEPEPMSLAIGVRRDQ